MTKLLKVCRACNLYTIDARCPKCGSSTSSAHPQKYSFHDNNAIWRRKALYE